MELKGKKAGIVVICPSRLVSGKEEEDPWKSLTKEEKWPFYEIVDRDIKRYKEDVSLAEEGYFVFKWNSL